MSGIPKCGEEIDFEKGGSKAEEGSYFIRCGQRRNLQSDDIFLRPEEHNLVNGGHSNQSSRISLTSTQDMTSMTSILKSLLNGFLREEWGKDLSGLEIL